MAALDRRVLAGTGIREHVELDLPAGADPCGPDLEGERQPVLDRRVRIEETRRRGRRARLDHAVERGVTAGGQAEPWRAEHGANLDRRRHPELGADGGAQMGRGHVAQRAKGHDGQVGIGDALDADRLPARNECVLAINRRTHAQAIRGGISHAEAPEPGIVGGIGREAEPGLPTSDRPGPDRVHGLSPGVRARDDEPAGPVLTPEQVVDDDGELRGNLLERALDVGQALRGDRAQLIRAGGAADRALLGVRQARRVVEP